MSRIGNNPISIPAGVEIKLDDNMLKVSGKNGTLEQVFNSNLNIAIEDGVVKVKRNSETKEAKSLHGLYRSLINNMVVGVSEGYKIEQELVGVGYRAKVAGQILEFNLGFSHPIFLQIPKEVKVTTESVKGKNPLITLESIDKQLIGQVAAKIRSLRPPEPYKGKGIKYVGEELRRKAGKTVAK